MTDNLVHAAEDALPGFINGLTWVVDHLGEIGSAIKVVVASFGAYKLATLAATISTEGFTAALMSNPFGAAAVALTALTVATIEYCKYVDDTSNFLSEEGKEVVRVTEELEDLNNRLRDSADAREDDIAQMETQASVAQKLVNELFDENTTLERKKQIVGELKELYPSLNTAIDEHGRLIGATQQQMQRYIDTSLQMAKVEAAKEHLTEIAKEQFEAEQALAKMDDERAIAVENLANAEKHYEEIEAKHSKTGITIAQNLFAGMELTEAKRGVDAAQEALDEFDKQQQETKDHVEELGKEYEKTLAYIGENEPIVESTEALNAMADAEEHSAEVTEALAKEFDELEESIRSSIESSLDLTNRWSQEWSTSTSEMTKNVDSQIEGIENWSKNFDKLANNAEVQLDQRVLKYIADMGIEGAGLVQELVNTLEKSPEELQGFADSMAKYLTLEDSVASRIAGSYVGAIENGLSGASSTAEQATQQMHDNIAAQMTNVGHDAVSSTQTAIEDGTDGVVTASEDVGQGIIDGVTEATGENGEKLEELGTTFDSALADGLRKDAAKKAAEEQSEKIYNAYANVLTSDAGYEIGSTFMGGMLSAVQEQGAALIELAKSIAAQIRSLLNAPFNEPRPGGNGGGGNGEGGEEGGGGGGGRGGNPNASNPNAPRPVNINQPAFNMAPSRMTTSYADMADSIERLGEAFATGMADATGTTQVNVELSGSASDIFNVVRNQNTKLVTATGYHALG